MLEGLDVSEVSLTQVLNQTLSLRFDAEFFKKQYLLDDSNLMARKLNKLSEVSLKIDVGFVGSMTEHYRDEGVVLLQTKNISSFFVSDNELIKITPLFHKALKKSQINFEDILIARSGSFGKAAIYLEKEVINSSDIIIIQAKKESISPYYLTVFLNSALGVNQMVRFASGGLQGHVNLTILEELKVPILDSKFQVNIEAVMKDAYLRLQQSKQRYAQAEQTLLEAVGLAAFKPSTQNTNIKTFAQSFGVSGRLDAEYYQPKYEEVMAKIASQSHAKLVDVVKIKKSIEPGSGAYADEGLPFIRVSDYSKYGLTTPDKCLSDSFVQDNHTLLEGLKPKVGTMLFSKDGSVGTAYLLREDLHGITSGAILHLSLKRDDVLPEYLTLVLNSKLVQMQAERDAGGSIILHWRVGEIENVILPIIDLTTQAKISQLVQQSFSLKAQSEHLLNVAKRAVEMAIEQDEDAAMAFVGAFNHAAY